MSALTSPSVGSTLTQRALKWIDSLALRLGRHRAIAPHLATGLRGEEEAFFYLRKRGYVVVARRWKTPRMQGDVDLIAWDGDTLCFVEVKTRTGRDIVPAEFAVDQQKQRILRSMASVFRRRLSDEKRRGTPIRFDVVSVYLPGVGQDARVEIDLFPTAFSYRPS